MHSHEQIKLSNGFIGINRLEGESLDDIFANLKVPFSKTELLPKWILGPFITANWLYTYQKNGEMRYALEVVDEHPKAQKYTVSVILSVYPKRKGFMELVEVIALFS